MKTSKFNEEFFAEAREIEVWKMLSEDSDFVCDRPLSGAR
jgi:hypothetical protein